MATCDDVFPEKPDDKYRFFNQPIEQIPQYDANVAQMLFHAAGGGLVWQSVPSGCVDVVQCIKLDTSSSETYSLTTTQKTIRPLQILDDPDPTGCIFPTQELDVVTCITLGSDSLVIERKKILVLNVRDGGSGCEAITTTACPTGGGSPSSGG